MQSLQLLSTFFLSHRCMHAGDALNTSQANTATSDAFVEMRVYKAKPEAAKSYNQLTTAAGNLRCQLLPFVG